MTIFLNTTVVLLWKFWSSTFKCWFVHSYLSTVLFRQCVTTSDAFCLVQLQQTLVHLAVTEPRQLMWSVLFICQSKIIHDIKLSDCPHADTSYSSTTDGYLLCNSWSFLRLLHFACSSQAELNPHAHGGINNKLIWFFEGGSTMSSNAYLTVHLSALPFF